jgi:hypothetical protein
LGLAADKFFSAGGLEDIVTASIDLALVYKCDPFTFLNLPPDQVNMLYKLTSNRLKEQAKESE